MQGQHLAQAYSIEQRFLTCLMLRPFKTAPHGLVTSNQRIVSLLLLDCSPDNARNHHVIIWYVTAKVVATHSFRTSG